MNYFNWISKALYSLVYFYYKLTGIAGRKVLIKSVKSFIGFHNLEIPVREFTALSKSRKSMGRSKVMIGRFEEEAFHYCVIYDLYIHRLYRRRALAQKLIKSGVKFCKQENFRNIVAIIKVKNTASLSLFRKCGFNILTKDRWTDWMSKEAALYNDEVVVAHFDIKKPAHI